MQMGKDWLSAPGAGKSPTQLSTRLSQEALKRAKAFRELAIDMLSRFEPFPSFSVNKEKEELQMSLSPEDHWSHPILSSLRWVPNPTRITSQPMR